MIEQLWKRCYTPGVTDSYHGDMAHAFALMLNDKEFTPDAWPKERRKIVESIFQHRRIEGSAGYLGRKWFTERLERDGTPRDWFTPVDTKGNPIK
jgi:hypothetical protein